MKFLILRIKTFLQKTLQWGQNILRTDLRYLVKGSFWLSVGQIISSITSFALLVVFTNLMPATNGDYKYILSIAGILGIFTLGGVNTTVTRSIARGYEGSLQQGLKTRMLWGMVGGCAGLLLSFYYFYNHSFALAIAVIMTSIFLPFFDPLGIYESYLQGKKQFRQMTRYYITTQISTTAIVLITLLLSRNLLLIVLAYFSSWTLFRWYYLKKTLRLPMNTLTEATTIPQGKHLSYMSVIGTVANYIDRLLVFHFFGDISLTVYSIAIAPTEQIKAFVKSIDTLAFPKFSVQTKETAKKNLYKKFLQLLLFTILITGFYIITAPYFFHLLFPKHNAAILYSQLYALSIPAYSLVLLYSFFQVHASSRQLYIFNTISSATEILLLLVGTPFGIVGLLGARVTSRFCNMILLLVLIRKI
jgi:O-antigen/teichoic acid export membrane protein